MKAMIWKEWRENAKWGGIASLVFAYATFYFGSDGLDIYSNSFNPVGHLTPVTLFLAPLFALVLGVLQVAPELRRDQWAFLMHRPVSRGVIFAGKAVAGLTLYFAATLLPLFALGLWLRSPGTIAAPFDWRLMLGPLSDIVGGAAFYFAGLLVTLRMARWYGSKALSVAAGVLGLTLSNAVPEFWQALTIGLLTTGLMALAAWGSFLTTGTYDRQPRIAKVALGTSTYLGMVSVIGVLSMLAVQVAGDYARRRDHIAVGEPSGSDWVDYGIAASGQILHYKYNSVGYLLGATDLRGQEIAGISGRKNDVQGRNYLQNLDSANSQTNFRSSGRYYQNLLMSNLANDRMSIYYWSAAQRRILIYSRNDNQLIGSAGPAGIVWNPARLAKPFSEDLRTGIYGFPAGFLLFEHSVYRLSEDWGPKLQKIYATSSPEGIRQVAGIFIPNLARHLLAIRVKNRLEFYDTDGKFWFGRTLDDQTADDYDLSIVVTPNARQFFFWFDPAPAQNATSTRHSFIEELNLRGELVSQSELPPAKRSAPTAPLFSSQPYWFETLAPIVEAPPVALAATLVYAHSISRDALDDRYRAELLGYLRALFIYGLIFSIAFVPVTRLICRRASLSKSATRRWMAATVPLGFSAILLLLALRAWPARVTCPKCGHLRSVENDLCEHCGSPFPIPERDETSIFEEQIADYNGERLFERV